MYAQSSTPIFETTYIDAVEIRVRAVRAASRAWLETLKLSNNALCNLSTSITDLNNIMAQVNVKTNSNNNSNNNNSELEDNMMHHTNAALIELSNRLTGLIGKHFQSKGDGKQDSLFGGMDELLKRITFINRKSLKKINAERERKEYYRRKVRRMRQKFILKRSLLPSSSHSSLFPIVTHKHYEKKIARNEIKLKYATRRYDTISERNAQDIAATLALCGEFFQPCFKQMILWLVTYYRSVAGAFDELGSCLDDDNDNNNNITTTASSSTTTNNDTTMKKTNTTTKHTKSAPTLTTTTTAATSSPSSSPLPSSTLNIKSKSDGELLVQDQEIEDVIVVVENSEKPTHKRSPNIIVTSKSEGDMSSDDNGNDATTTTITTTTTSSTTSTTNNNNLFIGNRPSAISASTITSDSDDQNENKSIIIKTNEINKTTATNPFLQEHYNPPTLGDDDENQINNKMKQQQQEQTFLSPHHSSPTTSATTSPSKEPLGGDRPYTILGELGKGAFGTTTLVMDERNNELYVLKRIICESVEQANEALDEARLMSNLRSKSEHVVEVHDFFLDIRDNNILSVCLVMEYVSGGDLAAKLKANTNPFFLDETKIINLIQQLLNGLIVIHNNGLVHRDLKPANLLLCDDSNNSNNNNNNNNGSNNVNLIKICDFGVATALSHSANTIVGTPHYMAPEIVEGGYGKSADIWSLGCILYEMCSLKRPDFAMTSLSNVLDEVRNRGYSSIITNLLERMLQRDPSKRENANSLLLYLMEEVG